MGYGSPQQHLRQLGTQRDLLKAPPVFVVAQQIFIGTKPVPRVAFVFELCRENVYDLDHGYGEEQRKCEDSPVYSSACYHLLRLLAHYVIHWL